MVRTRLCGSGVSGRIGNPPLRKGRCSSSTRELCGCHCVPRASNARPYLRCILSVLYQSLTPVLQGIFCLGVMFVQLDFSCRRRRRWRWAVPLVLAALLLALPQLAALRPAALARVDRVVGRHYMTRLDALQQENFTLHQQLAQSAAALAENAALRQLVGCGRASPASPPARVVARGVGGFHAGLPGRRAGGMPSSTRAGGTRGRYPHGRRHLHCGIFRRCRALRQLCRVGHAGAVGPDRSACRLRTDGRGHRDHRRRGLAGHTGHRAHPRRRRPDRAGPADRHRRFVGHGLFREKVIAFSSNFGYNK